MKQHHDTIVANKFPDAPKAPVSNRTLITVMAHAAAADTFERHFPFWKAHTAEGSDLFFVFPEGQAIRGLGYPGIEVGRAQHDGTVAIGRFRTVLEHMAGLPDYDRFVFMEYDSFILGRLPKLETDIAGNLFSDDSGQWEGKSFIHPPFMVGDVALRRIVSEVQKMPLSIERGMWDRMLGLAVERAQLVATSWIKTGYGYSHNTIHPDRFADMRNAILKGSHALHGVKTEECLKEVLTAWSVRQKIDEVEAAGHKVELSL